MDMYQESAEIDLWKLMSRLLKSVKRFWWIILGCSVCCAVLIPLVFQWNHTPEYKAIGSFSVRVVSNSVTESIHTQYNIYYDKDMAEQLDKTFVYILTSDHLQDEVSQRLGKELDAGRITAHCIQGSNLFEIAAFGSTPEDAYTLLVTVMDVFPDAARYIVGDLVVEIMEEPEANPTPANAVNVKLLAAVGALAGAFVILAVLVLKDLFRKTIEHPEELEEVLNMHCLGVVPITAERINNITDGEFRESIFGIGRKVETALNRDKEKVLLVTSTYAEEGKSLIARCLAQALAEWGKRVYLVDCDLRKPSLYKLFKCRNTRLPMEDYLKGNGELSSLLHTTNIQGLTLVGNTEKVREPDVLLASQTMKDMIETLAENSDYVILDAPACDGLSDVAVLQHYAQQILYVTRQDYATKEQVVDAVGHLTDDESKLMGFVLNFAEKTSSGYGKYGYGAYSYGKYGNGYYGQYSRYSRYSKYYHTDDVGGPSER